MRRLRFIVEPFVLALAAGLLTATTLRIAEILG